MRVLFHGSAAEPAFGYVQVLPAIRCCEDVSSAWNLVRRSKNHRLQKIVDVAASYTAKSQSAQQRFHAQA
jgi:predicted NBD/HSP70 family sugar kinase